MITPLLFSLHLSLHFHGVTYPQVGMRTENRQRIKVQLKKMFSVVVFCKCVYSQELLKMKHGSSGKRKPLHRYMLVYLYA